MDITVMFEEPDEDGAAYLELVDIPDGGAVRQRVVPVTGGELVLDFDAQDRLLGIEFLGEATLPPGWPGSSP